MRAEQAGSSGTARQADTSRPFEVFSFSLFDDEFLVIRVAEQVAPVSLTLLTLAERDVAVRLYEGSSYLAIARELGKSPRTVAVQVASIFRKLRVASRSELVARLATETALPARAR